MRPQIRRKLSAADYPAEDMAYQVDTMLNLLKCTVGIEFGSTRIKAVLIDENCKVLASGGYDWENKLENGLWTYSYEEIVRGLQTCYAALKEDIKQKFGVTAKSFGAIGISAMMHGYIPLDGRDKPLVAFRTWRNNNAESAAGELTRLFSYPIPARWSIAHLYEAVKDGEPHVKDIKKLCTLAVYVHYLLTGRFCAGIGEASGMFPIDTADKNYSRRMLESFRAYCGVDAVALLPEVLIAGVEGGKLTESGALLLDPSGETEAGILLCPPEGDAGTGMVATNSVKPGTGNISAGTSVFGMAVLKAPLKNVHSGIDLVTTPCGDEVAMVHCNNCSSEINAWVNIFGEFAKAIGADISRNELYKVLFTRSLSGEEDCGGAVVCNYLSGENIAGVEKGVPAAIHTAECNFTLGNFMRAQLYSAFVTLKLGMDVLTRDENVKLDKIYAHGGIFKTEGVCQKFLAAAINTPVSVLETAGEGGAWGMAVLAACTLKGAELEKFLSGTVFVNSAEKVVSPDAACADGFDRYTRNFGKLLSAEKVLSDIL